MTSTSLPHPHEQRKGEKLLLKLANMQPGQPSLSSPGEPSRRTRDTQPQEISLTLGESEEQI